MSVADQVKTLAGCLLAAAMATIALVGPATAKEPRVPPGLNPGGVAVALLGPGVDYRLPEIAKRLARDGEGDLIGWDFTDNDTKPFAESGPGMRWVQMLAVWAPKAVAVVVKEAPGDPNALGRLIQFALKTPAKIIVWPAASPKRPDWPILAEAVLRFPDRLFIIPSYDRYDIGKMPAQAGSAAANLITVDYVTGQQDGLPRVADIVMTNPSGKKHLLHAKDAPDAAVYVAARCAEALAANSTLTSADLKKLILDLK
ncbi:MAG: hypothetical protein ACI89J_000589 [Hyphomicrobiaceae bacterium]|jgi:hypothetical protein